MEISDKTIGKPLGNHGILGDENGDLSSTNEDTMILIGNTRPGTLTVCELENHHFYWVNQRTKWSLSIAFCMFTRGYPTNFIPWSKHGNP